jgi:hypothetical protein
VTGTYHFTTRQSAQSLKEAEMVIKTVAWVQQVSVDSPTASLTFSGALEAVNFAEWILPQIDKAAGDVAVHEYKLPSGDVGRVSFVVNVQKPQELQEVLTILRTVADVRRIVTFSSIHAVVLVGPDWQVAFAEWILDQIQQKPDSTPHEFTVGGPDYRGLGHGARVNFLSNMTAPRQMQELLTVIRTIDDVQKIFSYTTGHAFVFRAGGSDLQQAEWLIQQLDVRAGQASGSTSFTAPGGDDVTRIFRLRNTDPEGIQAAVTGLRTDLNIKKIFPIMDPATIIVRGTTAQIAATSTWMAVHAVLVE